LTLSLDIGDLLLDVEQTLPERFDLLTARYPDRPAINCGTWRPTYSELRARSEAIAMALISEGVMPGDRVALLMQHDGPLFAAVLGVLKAGAIVVTLSPAEPAARLAQILDDAEPRLLITDDPNAALAAALPSAARTLKVTALQRPAAGVARVAMQPQDVAFLLYTSGSTGQPKGVMQTHRNILHNTMRLGRGMALTPRDRIALPTAIGGGHGVAVLWCALATGAALYPFSAVTRGVTGLAEWLQENGITVLSMSASLFRHFIKTVPDDKCFATVRAVRIGSESATREDFLSFKKHFPANATLVHTFSSTETGNITQMHLRPADDVATDVLPVGGAVPGVEVVIEVDGKPAAPGAAGHVFIQSQYLSPGYWRNDGLTQQRFAGPPYPHGLRRYQMGDRARRTEDGAIWFAGRSDAQVKIHGFRVELSEIEAKIRASQLVSAAAVIGREEPDGGATLVAFVVPREVKAFSAARLRESLTQVLPRHMVPTHYEAIERLPLTSHGKVDRKALASMPLHEVTPMATTDAAAARTTTEQLLVDLWQNVFPRQQITRESDFFALGGDSLIASVVAARIHAVRRVAPELLAFSECPRLADLAAHIDRLAEQPSASRLDLPAITPDPDASPAPLSFAQEAIWHESQRRKGRRAFTMATSIRIRGPLDVPVLRQAISRIVARHTILRTTFETIAGSTRQVVHPAGQIDLPVQDVSSAANPGEAVTRLLRREARQVFALDRLPLMKFALARTGADEHYLLRVNHHINSDATSWRIFLNELAQLYEAAIRHAPPPLPEVRQLQFGDFARWQRRVISPQSSQFAREVGWWAQRYRDTIVPAELPFARRFRNHFARSRDGMIWWGMERDIASRIDRAAATAHVTGFVARLAAFALLLSEACNRPTVAVGIYLSNRILTETFDMFGPCTNLAVLPLTPDGSVTFNRWMQTVGNDVSAMQAHSLMPRAMLVDTLRQQGVTAPEPQVIFRVNDHTATQKFGGLELSWTDRAMEAMPWRFTMSVDPFDEQRRCHVAFDARRYRPEGVRGFIDRYVALLAAAGAAPETPLRDLLGRTE